jgi:hypothetical protein
MNCVRLGIFILILALNCGVILAQDTGIDKPVLIEIPKLPDLPAVFRQSNAKGTLLIKVQVTSMGDVDKVEFIKASSMKKLDNFVAEWVKMWKFLPRVTKTEAITTFSVLSIRYDLAEGKFETPPVLNAPMILPESLANQRSPEGITSSTNKKQAFPRTPLKISEIPLDIQKLNLQGVIICTFTVNPKGTVLQVDLESEIKDFNILKWLKDYLLLTEWDIENIQQNSGECKIVVQIDINTAICKIKFEIPYFKEN